MSHPTITMSKNRLEAFSDGVIAIIITIMVLELKVPHGHDLEAMKPLMSVFVGYALSFVYVGIYWNNHHHLLHATKGVSAGIMWANLHLLFWLSLLPFVTEWMGESHGAAWPTAMYGFVLLCCALAYTLLVVAIVRHEGPTSNVARAIGSDTKGKISLVCYLSAMGVTFFLPWLAHLLYFVVAMIWLIPDRRIESTLAHE
jgi:uncharacterized membrane protein